MKKYQTFYVLLAFLFFAFWVSPVFCADSVDGVCGASRKNYYEKTSLSGAELIKLVKSHNAAFVLSTTNPDGSPNAGVFIPGVVSDSVLKFGMAKNQTALNIKRTKQAVLTVYRLEDRSGKKFHYGARLLLELLEGEGKVLQMKIKSVLPLG